VNKILRLGLLCLPLCACVDLPGSTASTHDRYGLQAAQPDSAQCEAGSTAITLVISSVGTGLDSNRVARRNVSSGEISYLQGVRWAESAGKLVEQQLALDLECNGYTVSTSHHRRLSRNRLECELRAFNLLQTENQDEAEVKLSCSYLQVANQNEVLLKTDQRSTLPTWSADAAIAAIRTAYKAAANDILRQLP
jgi:ABC-type uncharacterized transport system auxiliary subunit